MAMQKYTPHKNGRGVLDRQRVVLRGGEAEAQNAAGTADTDGRPCSASVRVGRAGVMEDGGCASCTDWRPFYSRSNGS